MDGEVLTRMIRSAAANLAEEKAQIDALNVFPVPDGDTGTNMYLTMAAALREAENVPTGTPGAIAEAAARGALMGARGNSGVILSQLLRGIAETIKETDRITPHIFANALQKGTEVAYRAVLKPVEGTILTVARGASEAALRAARENKGTEGVLAAALEGARTTLAGTPKLLPVLVQAGVIDAGGKGWEIVLAGFLAGTRGEYGVQNESRIMAKEKSPEVSVGTSELPRTGADFKYCTELLIKIHDQFTEIIKQRLAPLGDSVLVVGTEDTLKVHLHSDHPGLVLEICLEYGDLDDIKIDNMSLQQQRTMPTVQKPLGIVAVSSGSGLKEILLSLGADEVITGGQSMNPSAEEIASAIERVPADNVIVLPNNSNIILTARLASDLTDKKTEIVPTRSIPQGIAALLALSPEKSLVENLNRMLEGCKNIISGEITFAVRDSSINGRIIKAGEILGIVDEEIRISGSEVNTVTMDLIISEIDEGREILTIYYGQDVTSAQAGELQREIAVRYPNLETELHYGGQPLYFYLFSIE